MSFPCTSSAFSNFSTSASSFQSHPQPQLQPRHRVPFGAVAGSQPGVLSWGIGMSPANRGGMGWATPTPTPAAPAAPSPSPSPSTSTSTNVQWGASTSTATTRRRRRSSTPDESDPEPLTLASSSTSTKRQRKVSQSTTSDGLGLATGLAGSLSLGSHSPTSSLPDVGKSLASLDKPALLSILSSVLSTHPHLVPTVTALLPAPTLSSTLDSITSLSRDLVAQIPQNSSPSYTHSRVRLALETFVQEARKLVSTYVPATLPSEPSPSASHQHHLGQGGGIRANTGDLYHPTTTMSFLVHLTDHYLSISRALPPRNRGPPAGAPDYSNPLEAHLLPTLINSYHVFLTRVSQSVNEQGKILAKSTVQNWFEHLDHLVVAKEEDENENEAVVTAKRALEGVRDRMRKEIGWLVGYKSVSSSMMGQSMEGVEEEEEL